MFPHVPWLTADNLNDSRAGQPNSLWSILLNSGDLSAYSLARPFGEIDDMGLIRPVLIAASLTVSGNASAADIPDEIAAKGETAVLEVRAVGLQIYECKADAAGKMVWQFREPIATLFRPVSFVGRARDLTSARRHPSRRPERNLCF
jgi:hypothetical protein